MLNSFIVVSVLKMEVFCCYERAFSAALHHEEPRAQVSLPPIVKPPGLSQERRQYLFDKIREFCPTTAKAWCSIS